MRGGFEAGLDLIPVSSVAGPLPLNSSKLLRQTRRRRLDDQKDFPRPKAIRPVVAGGRLVGLASRTLLSIAPKREPVNSLRQIQRGRLAAPVFSGEHVPSGQLGPPLIQQTDGASPTERRQLDRQPNFAGRFGNLDRQPGLAIESADGAPRIVRAVAPPFEAEHRRMLGRAKTLPIEDDRRGFLVNDGMAKPVEHLREIQRLLGGRPGPSVEDRVSVAVDG